MVSSLRTVLSATLALATIVAGSPAGTASESTSGEKQFSVHQVKNPNFVTNGPQAIARAYAKYGVIMPEALAEVVRKNKKQHSKRSGGNEGAGRSQGSVVTTPEPGDYEWLTPVQIGTPGVTLNLNFDTGSADLWVFTNTTSGGSVGRSVYNPIKSRTAKKIEGASFGIRYGDGSSSSGDVYTDRVSIGRLTVNNQSVEAAEQVTGNLIPDIDLDGILGLAFDSLNTVRPNPQKTWFDNAIPQLNSPVFTANLKHRQPGTYNFGYIDNASYTGKIGYASVDTSDGFWTFSATNYAVGSGRVNRTSLTGIADTGTTLLLLPNSTNKAYYDQVRGARFDRRYQLYTFACRATMPTFSFTVGGTNITIPGAYFNIGSVGDGSSNCVGGLQPSEGFGINIFGDVALKAAFVVFDGGNRKRIGWAKKNFTHQIVSMSFGFSVGDILAVGRPVADIASCLRESGGSRDEYQGIVRELECIRRMLDHLENLSNGDSSPELDSIKHDALSCRQPLEEFLARIQKYSRSLSTQSKSNAIKGVIDKIGFLLNHRDDIRKLQTYLNVHLGSINVLLAKHGLNTVKLAADRCQTDHLQIKERLGTSTDLLSRIQTSIANQGPIISKTMSVAGMIFDILSEEVKAPLQLLEKGVESI
ncbi:aspartic ase precursor, partial [Fusarium albosuccineum]